MKRMILVENQPECDACPEDWACCKHNQFGACLDFDSDTHHCLRTVKSLVCLRTACKHMAIYQDGTLQTLLNEMDERLDKNPCIGCGEPPVILRLNNKQVEYWCWDCYQQVVSEIQTKIGL